MNKETSLRNSSAVVWVVAVLLGCATQPPRPNLLANEPYWESASALKYPRCPAEMRAASPDIDSTSDWRVVVDDGFRYCIPGDWSTQMPAPKRPDIIPWRGENGGMTVFTHLQFAGGFIPVERGTTEQVYIGKVGGVPVRMWTSQPETQLEAGAKDQRGPLMSWSGHLSYVAWASRGVMFRSGGRTAKQALYLRVVARTVVFTDTTAR